MRILMSTLIGIIAANAGFAAGMVGTILVGPLTGTVYPAVTAGFAVGLMAMLASFVVVMRSLSRLRYAVLLSH